MHGVDPLGSFVLRPNYDRTLDSVGCKPPRGARTIVRGWGVASKPYLATE
jgi:hypothetical protein